MEVFPCPVDSVPPRQPSSEPTLDNLTQAYPTLNRCTKCGSCTTACPMSIPVMDSVLRMQTGNFEQVSEDFTTCIHCGLCRFVCEDRVNPHQMGMWVRRSMGMGEFSKQASQLEATDEKAQSEWDYLLDADPEERLERAKSFRTKGSL